MRIVRTLSLSKRFGILIGVFTLGFAGYGAWQLQAGKLRDDVSIFKLS